MADNDGQGLCRSLGDVCHNAGGKPEHRKRESQDQGQKRPAQRSADHIENCPCGQEWEDSQGEIRKRLIPGDSVAEVYPGVCRSRILISGRWTVRSFTGAVSTIVRGSHDGDRVVTAFRHPLVRIRRHERVLPQRQADENLRRV